MHNFNLTPIPTASQNVTNLSILEESCNNNSYSHWVDINSMTDAALASSALLIVPTSTTPGAWELPNAVTSGVCFYVRRHGDWKLGAFDLKVHAYGGGTGNVVYNASITNVIDSTAFASPTTCSFDAVAYTTSPKVCTLLSSALRVSSSIDKRHVGSYVVLMRVGANGSDTLASSVYITGVELIYNETKRVVGETIKK